MKATITHPSWYQIDKACAVLASKLIPFHTKETAIIGLARGGLVPAVITSHILGLKVFPVSYSSQAGNGEYKQYENQLPDLIVRGFPRVIIIDDIVDSGHTMKEVAEHYISKHTKHSVTTCSLYYKVDSVYRPDLFWQEIPADSPWIEFPWEI